MKVKKVRANFDVLEREELQGKGEDVWHDIQFWWSSLTNQFCTQDDEDEKPKGDDEELPDYDEDEEEDDNDYVEEYFDNGEGDDDDYLGGPRAGDDGGGNELSLSILLLSLIDFINRHIWLIPI